MILRKKQHWQDKKVNLRDVYRVSFSVYFKENSIHKKLNDCGPVISLWLYEDDWRDYFDLKVA